jgi:hypothetical protein
MIAAAAIIVASLLAAEGTARVAGTTAPTQGQGGEPRFRHVLVVSVDGCRPDAIDGPEDGPLPGFRRLMRGPHTLQARADATLTITLPNHVSMATGRPVGGSAGHGWVLNDDPPAAKDGGTLHKRRGTYVASMFDVAHDRGAATAVIATKSKFSLMAQSYDDEHGAADGSGADDGKDKVDAFASVRTSRMAREATFAWIRSQQGPSLTMLHFAAPDLAGHETGWDLAPGTPYRRAIAEVDGELAALLASIDAEPSLRGQVAVILTADHGGGVPFISHTVAMAPENFVIPFLVWLGEDRAPAELAALNADRRAVAPATQYLGDDASPAPIRNAEAGNLALSLLGMPAIPGSVANAKQDLLLQEPAR